MIEKKPKISQIKGRGLVIGITFRKRPNWVDLPSGVANFVMGVHPPYSCGEVYIGETCCSIKTRLREH